MPWSGLCGAPNTPNIISFLLLLFATSVTITINTFCTTITIIIIVICITIMHIIIILMGCAQTAAVGDPMVVGLLLF